LLDIAGKSHTVAVVERVKKGRQAGIWINKAGYQESIRLYFVRKFEM